MSLHDTVVAQEYPITIGIATASREKEEIYRLRYQIYVEEMAMQLTSVDHSNSLLYDQLDKWAILIYAKAGPKTIGTIRINIGPLSKFPPDLVQILSLNRFQKFYKENNQQSFFAYSSKLMVDPYYRNTAALHLLTAKAYELGCGQVQFCFGVCNFHLLRLYEQIGWRRLDRSFTAPGYDGVLIPLVLLIDDIEYFRAVRSPLYRIARKRGLLNTCAAGWFREEFTEHSNTMNSQLVTEEELWAFLRKRLRHEPNLTIRVLDRLSAAEARQFLHYCGIIIQCRAGDYITLCGYTSHTLGILITGRLSPGFAGSEADTILPGHCFGTAGLVGQPRYTEDIYAVTDTEILIISRLSFHKFQHSHPDIALKIIQNIETFTDEQIRTNQATKIRLK
ncbi:cyclic nucleotide-binding domain-containing protein [Sporomusa sp.]|uniref:cyclic nucleotide-binding domain-containing protein n=1 Tax=Sporomusa sp. TaxID=2078658 RepID=UPI002BB88C0D|nr:cyclic nucleotide-binding domain-containing protein [Sporomusa sp.]HWR45317.1 cyclic nucleotide-binding domain-containing protein [Sporomusa sp.]